jgi:hypothetical protein
MKWYSTENADAAGKLTVMRRQWRRRFESQSEKEQEN